MAYSDGGGKLTIVASYVTGEDSYVTYGRHRFLAQTFTLTEEKVIWRCRFKYWTACAGNFYHFKLYHTDAQGKPTGAPIDSTSLSPTNESTRSPGEWRRFDFGTFPKLAPGVYALVASCPTAVNWTCVHLRADESAAAYGQGKAWISGDDGDSWAEIPNTDFMFEVWGYSTPPEPPPPASISNWSGRDIKFKYLCDGFIIVVTTDIRSHLYLRYTKVKPQIHSKPIYLRGIYLHSEVYFCFVAFTDNEQEEEGDTFTHTFIKRNWPVCETRHFYFYGSVATRMQVSTTAIFKLHFNITMIDVFGSYSNRTIRARGADWKPTHDLPIGDVLPFHDGPHYVISPSLWHTASKFFHRAYLSFDTTRLSPHKPIVGAQLKLFYFHKEFLWPVSHPHVCITQGVQHDPVVALDYGNQLPYTTIGGQIDVRDIVIDQYNIMPFNETGLAWIIRGGITRLCLRMESDIVESYGPWGSIEANFRSRQMGGSVVPILTVCQEPD